MNFRSVFVAAISSLGLIACSGAEENTGATTSGDVSFVAGDVVLGDANAPLEIIEYASTTCGHCRTFHKTILPRLKEDYVATGKAKLIFRDLPTPPAPVAAAGGALARCAGEAKYYEALDDIFTNQYEILQATRSGGALNELVKIGERHGLSADEVRACIQNKDVISEIGRTADLANQDGVNSTPQLFVNGENVGEALRTYETLSAYLDEKLGIAPESEDTEASEPAPATEEAAE